MARLKFVLHERQLAYQKAVEILDEEEAQKARRAEERPKFFPGLAPEGPLNVRMLPRIIRERMRKFRFDTFKEVTNITPVSVNSRQPKSTSS